MAQQSLPQSRSFDDIIRKALKTPPISNEEIERRSKAQRVQRLRGVPMSGRPTK